VSIADERYGRLPPPPSVFKRTSNPTRPSEEQGGGLPRKKGTAASWPRRCRRGLLCVVTTEPLRTAAVDRAVPDFPEPYGILPSPVFEAPARFVEKYQKRGGDAKRVSTGKGPGTRQRYRRLYGASI